MMDARQAIAVQYLRMSTEHQRYSFTNQAHAIQAYADAHGLNIARSYFDAGRSGLTLQGRPGLQALLAAALSPDRSFASVLVHDVSRWGRFQDPDEAAHYEFICREAGVRLIYCAEPFENDGGSVNAIVKQLKRIMAAEYSRELSAKVLRAQLRLAALGFHQGGCRVFGVDRLIIDDKGRPRFVVRAGDRKAIATDRVILVPGPAEEIRVIRRIFRAFVIDLTSLTGIAAQLNAEGILTSSGGAWRPEAIRKVLTQPLMQGVYIYNRTSMQLRSPRRHNHREDWVQVEVMPPLVSRTLFAKAATRLATPNRERLRRDRMLQALRQLAQREGRLNIAIINRDPNTPWAHTYVKYFGSLTEAYRKIGYVVQRRRWAPRLEDPGANNEELLALLKTAYARHGYLTHVIIDDDEDLPSSYLYRRRFGSLASAYAAAGLPHTRSELSRLGARRGADRAVVAARVARPQSYTPKELVDALRMAAERHGHVSARVLKRDETMPPLSGYLRTFGSLYTAYAVAGLPFEPRGVHLASMKRRSEFLARRRGRLQAVQQG